MITFIEQSENEYIEVRTLPVGEFFKSISTDSIWANRIQPGTMPKRLY